MALGSFVSLLVLFGTVDLWTQKIQADVDYCCVCAAEGCAECTSLGPGLEHPSLL